MSTVARAYSAGYMCMRLVPCAMFPCTISWELIVNLLWACVTGYFTDVGTVREVKSRVQGHMHSQSALELWCQALNQTCPPTWDIQWSWQNYFHFEWKMIMHLRAATKETSSYKVTNIWFEILWIYDNLCIISWLIHPQTSLSFQLHLPLLYWKMTQVTQIWW